MTSMLQKFSKKRPEHNQLISVDMSGFGRRHHIEGCYRFEVHHTYPNELYKTIDGKEVRIERFTDDAEWVAVYDVIEAFDELLSSAAIDGVTGDGQ